MTRDEAIKKWDGINIHATTHPIDCLVAFGLLKLDPPPPKSARDVVSYQLRGQVPFEENRDGVADDILKALGSEGFNLYRKPPIGPEPDWIQKAAIEAIRAHLVGLTHAPQATALGVFKAIESADLRIKPKD